MAVKLEPRIFNQVCKLMNFYPKIDGFAARHNTQLKDYWSWRADPYAQKINAMAQSWKEKKLYLNPPWPLLHQVTIKIILVCDLSIKYEASWKCKKCENYVHLRCDKKFINRKYYWCKYRLQ